MIRARWSPCSRRKAQPFAAIIWIGIKHYPKVAAFFLTPAKCCVNEMHERDIADINRGAINISIQCSAKLGFVPVRVGV